MNCGRRHLYRLGRTTFALSLCPNILPPLPIVPKSGGMVHSISPCIIYSRHSGRIVNGITAAVIPLCSQKAIDQPLSNADLREIGNERSEIRSRQSRALSPPHGREVEETQHATEVSAEISGQRNWTQKAP
jgi:hypothetical protein